jgi:hypothetical protein
MNRLTQHRKYIKDHIYIQFLRQHRSPRQLKGYRLYVPSRVCFGRRIGFVIHIDCLICGTIHQQQPGAMFDGRTEDTKIQRKDGGSRTVRIFCWCSEFYIGNADAVGNMVCRTIILQPSVAPDFAILRHERFLVQSNIAETFIRIQLM